MRLVRFRLIEAFLFLRARLTVDPEMNYALMIDISTLWKVDGGANEFRANVFNHVHLDVSAYLHDWKPSRPALAKRVAKLHSNDIFNLSRFFRVRTPLRWSGAFSCIYYPHK